MSPAPPSPATEMEDRLAAHLARCAGALAVPPAPPGPLIHRSRTRRRRRRVAGSVAGATVVLITGMVLADGRRGTRTEGENVHAAASPPGRPETVHRQWPQTPLRLGLANPTFPIEVLEVRDADWTPGPRMDGPPGVVHQRLRPSFERFEGPTIDLVAVPDGPWPTDADLSVVPETLAGPISQVWIAGGDRPRAAWRDAGGRTVKASAVGLTTDELRAVVRGLIPLQDGRYTYTADEPVALTTVLDLSDPPLIGATSLVRYRVGSGSEPPAGDVTIEVTLGDHDAFEDRLGTGREWRTVPVGEHVAATDGTEVRWYDAGADAIVRVAAPNGDVLARSLSALGELSEDQFQTLRHRAPGAGGG